MQSEMIQVHPFPHSIPEAIAYVSNLPSAAWWVIGIAVVVVLFAITATSNHSKRGIR